MRAVESIVGEPVNVQEARNLYRFEQKWKTAGFDRRSQFKRMKQPIINAFVDFYSQFRNPSAHGYKLNADRLERIEVIDVQALATKFMLGYIKTNAKKTDEAIRLLNANHGLIEKLLKGRDEPVTIKTRRK